MTTINKEELEESELHQLQQIEKAYIEYDLFTIEHLSCQVDLLQNFLQEKGFRPFMKDIDAIWYDNVISDISGYTAYMKVISPNGKLWALTVVGSEEGDKIVQVQKEPNQFDSYKRLRSVWHKDELGAISTLVEDRLGFYEVSVFKPDSVEPLSLKEAIELFKDRTDDQSWKRIY